MLHFDQIKFRNEYLSRLKEDETITFIKNVSVDIELWDGFGVLIPLVIPGNNLKESYVCSLKSHYIEYAKYELSRLGVGSKGWILRILIFILENLLKFAKSERVVFVDNLLLSTNIHPSELASFTLRINAYIENKYPGRAIVYRSLNSYFDSALASSLKQLGFKKFCSRIIYLVDFAQSNPRRRSDFRKDLKLLEKTSLVIVPAHMFLKRDLGEANRLYELLYLEKYSILNPAFSVRFFEISFESGFMKFIGIKSDEQLVGVIGYYICENIMTAPIFGYDTSKPKEMGLYRMLSTLLRLEAERLNCRLHCSSGADQFKLQRGAVRTLEYSYVCYRHLSFVRRLAWSIGEVLLLVVEKCFLKWILKIKI